MCCAAPAGVPRTRLALESRWILTIALSLKSLFTSARMSIIEATCARTSPELYLQCVADEQAGLSLGFDLANWTDEPPRATLVNAAPLHGLALESFVRQIWPMCFQDQQGVRRRPYSALGQRGLFRRYSAFARSTLGRRHRHSRTRASAHANQDVAGVPFSDFKDHRPRSSVAGNQFTWWDLFKSAPTC